MSNFSNDVFIDNSYMKVDGNELHIASIINFYCESKKKARNKSKEAEVIDAGVSCAPK